MPERIITHHTVHLFAFGTAEAIEISYTWVKQALQGAGLVARRKTGSSHRRRRPRRPLPGMLLHIDGSKHGWFDDRYYDLLVILDDATSEIYYAQLVEEEQRVR